jgi:hypothetical protein
MSSISSTSGLSPIAAMLQSSGSAATTTTSTLTGIAGLMQTANSGSSGLLDAISGSTTTTSSAAGIFNVLAPGSTTTSIDGLLKQQKYTTQKNALFASIAQRLDYIQKGSYTPKADWEKVAGYAMQTGQPLVVSLDSKGAVQATPQAQADLSQFNSQQQKQLNQALSDVATMAAKIKANKTNQSMIDKLDGAANDLAAVFTGAVAPQKSTPNNWEQQGVQLMTLHHPFTISLDTKGNLQVQDQLTDSLSNVPLGQQKTLRAALQSLPKAVATGNINQLWQATALTYDRDAVPYHLKIDSYTNQISAVANTGDNITPDFLKKQPYSDIGANSPLLKQAAKFIQDGQPFMLNFNTTGHVVAQAATAQNLIKYNTPSTQQASLGIGSILSTVA